MSGQLEDDIEYLSRLGFDKAIVRQTPQGLIAHVAETFRIIESEGEHVIFRLPFKDNPFAELKGCVALAAQQVAEREIK